MSVKIHYKFVDDFVRYMKNIKFSFDNLEKIIAKYIFENKYKIYKELIEKNSRKVNKDTFVK